MICIVCASFTLKAQQGTERYSFCPSAPIAKDHEGNVYRTVQIGSQCWMAENMRCTTSPTGQRWYSNPYFSASQPEYAAYYATPLDARHGILYNWAAAMDLPAHQSHGKAVSGPVRGICPEGWRLPNNADWDLLFNSLGGTLASMRCLLVPTPRTNISITVFSLFSGVPKRSVATRPGAAFFTIIRMTDTATWSTSAMGTRYGA